MIIIVVIFFQTVITGKMRATLIDWLVEVQRQFSLVLETFHLTVGIIDRYLQVNKDCFILCYTF